MTAGLTHNHTEVDGVLYPSQQQQLREIHRLLAETTSAVIAIWGPPGAGKSTIIEQLAAVSGPDSETAIQVAPARMRPDALCRILPALRMRALTDARDPEVRGNTALVLDAQDAPTAEVNALIDAWSQCTTQELGIRLVIVCRNPPSGAHLQLAEVSGLEAKRAAGTSPGDCEAMDFARWWQQRSGAGLLGQERLAELIALTAGNPLALRLGTAALIGGHPLRGSGVTGVLNHCIDALTAGLSPNALRLLRQLAHLPASLPAHITEQVYRTTGPKESVASSFAASIHELHASRLVNLDWGRDQSRIKLDSYVSSRIRELSPETPRLRAWAEYDAIVSNGLIEVSTDSNPTLDELSRWETPLWAKVFAQPGGDSPGSAPVGTAEIHEALGALDEFYQLRGERAEWALVIAAIEIEIDRMSRELPPPPAGDSTPSPAWGRWAWLTWKLGRFLIRDYALDEAEAAIERMYDVAVARDDTRLLARAALDRGAVARLNGREDERRYWLERTEKYGLRAGDHDALGVLTIEKLIGAVMDFDLEGATATVDPLTLYWRFTGSQYRAYGDVNIARIHQYSGRLRAARAGYARAARAAGHGQSGSIALGLTELGIGQMHAASGEIGLARDHWLRSWNHLETVAGRPWIRELAVELAAEAELRGDTKAAREYSERAIELLERRPSLSALDGVLALRLSAALVRRGESDRTSHLQSRGEEALQRTDHSAALRAAALHRWWLGEQSPDELDALWEAASREPPLLPGTWDGLLWLQRVQTSMTDSAVLIQADGHWFEIRGKRTSLIRRPVARAIVQTLIQNHRVHPARAVPTADLIGRVWPGDSCSWESLTARLYVAVSQLRKQGLRSTLISAGDGYRLSEHVRVAPDGTAT